MVYRFNERESVLRKQHQEAKAVLEELAENGHYDSENKFFAGRLNYALEDLGFRRETIVRHRNGNPANVYVRENQGNLEILADRNLAEDRLSSKRVMHLYQIPTRQDVDVWYNINPSFSEWKVIHNNNIGNIGLSVMAVSVVLGGALDYMTGMFLFGWISPAIIGNIALLYKEHKKHPLQSQVIAKGSDAIHYIAQNSSYNSASNVPKLRIANPDTGKNPSAKNIPIQEDKFTDEQAELDVSAEDDARKLTANKIK
ncbi:MAG: hypothetical protein AABY40_04800 [Nanoarchaeota archaeon]